MERLGFDFAHGRLDVSLHPFCGGTPDDVRLTTRYEEADFNRALMGVLHETGHALYERGLPPEWRRPPVGDARVSRARRHPPLDVVQDCLGILAARVVRRQHHEIAASPGGFAHQRTFGPVAVAAASKHCNYPPFLLCTLDELSRQRG